MPTFKLDGKPIPFEPGDTIIKAAWRQGIEIPHYCWHPGLSAPANCRMCLVEIMPKPGARAMMLDVLEWDAKVGDYRPVQKPKLQPSCYTPAAEGMEILSDSSSHVVKARKDVQEFLLLNHPVDCPICDQSGECKLQDYWLEHGQYQKRMRDEPVHKPKGVVFGPTIVYDAERCVMCTRCVRFMAEVAKDPVLDMRERGNLNEITVAPGRELDGHYTFMTEHVCPVGALTTQDFRFKARVWFLRTAPAVCQGCATGCNAHLDYDPRYNKAYRYRPRDNEKVNKFWMCDEGMLSYKAAHEGRVLDAKVRGAVTSNAKALEEVKKLFEGVPKEGIGVVLSAQHALEDNWALLELARVLIETPHVFESGKPDGYEDTILIHRDKNPNTKGVAQLAPGARPLQALIDDVVAGRITHVLALGGAVPVDAEALAKAKVVTIASHVGTLTDIATVLLPATSWAEHSGTYVNARGMRQVSEKALEPQGVSKPGWRQVSDVASALGYEAQWTKLKQIRAQLIGIAAIEPGQAASAVRLDAGAEQTMTATQLVWTIIKIAIMVGFVLNLAAILTWADRRQSSMIQDRIGPNRAVVKIFGKEFRLAGLLHPAADGLKFFTKEDFMPPKADKLLFTLAPILAMGMVFTLVGTIPFGDSVCLHQFRVGFPNIFHGDAVPRWGVCSSDVKNGYFPIDLQIAPLDVGILYVFAMSGQGIIAAAIAGWSSDNKFSLMGALRAASQMVSYEVTLGMSLVGAMMVYNTVRLDDMVRWQSDHAWGIFVQPLAFFLFFTAAVAENKRIPFDLPEAESELVSGYFTEYAGMKFGMFYFAEYAEVVTGSMLIVTIFLGGWALPFFHRDGLTIAFGSSELLHLSISHLWMTLIGVLAFFGKVLAVCFVQVFVRWTLPRFRYDQLMKLGWRVLLPLSLANVLLTGIMIWLLVDKAGPETNAAFQTLGDVTQAIVVVVVSYLTLKLVMGIFAPLKHQRNLLGSSAEMAEKRGGTKTEAMQA